MNDPTGTCGPTLARTADRQTIGPADLTAVRGNGANNGSNTIVTHSWSEQPDLNWRNEAVHQAIADVMRFWLNRGVDGFRADASAVLIKDDLLRDNPADPDADANTPPPQRYVPVFTDDRPEAMRCIEWMRQVIDEFDHRVLCGEVQGKTDRVGHFYGAEKPRLNLPLNFALLDRDWNALSLQAAIDSYFNALPEGAWPVWVIGGHDKRRIESKIGQAQLRALAMLLMTLPGTPFLYMGDEIGKERSPIPAAQVQDAFEKLVPGFGLGRDPERTPMRWDDTPNGGFTKGKPWLPMNDDRSRNVARQAGDERSNLQLFRQLIDLRRRELCLIDGTYRPCRSRNDILSFERVSGRARVSVVLNISSEPRRWECCEPGDRLISTNLDRPREPVAGPVLLRPNEGILVKHG
jgi:alpha-glucosidase